MGLIGDELRNIVRHREDGGLSSVTGAMFVIGALMYLNALIIWNLSVWLGFDVDPNAYQFIERAGYVLMSARPVQEGARYIGGARTHYRRRRRRESEEDLDDEPSPDAPKPEPVVEDPRGVKGRWILMADGSRMSLSDWQVSRGYSEGQVGRYFWMNTDPHFARKHWILCEHHLDTMDDFREELGAPWTIGSMYRAEGKDSTHEWGLGVDHQCAYLYDKNGDRTPDTKDIKKRVAVIRKVLKRRGLKARVTWLSYQKAAIPLSIIHVDFGPMYFTPGTSQPFVRFRDLLSDKAKRSWHLESENLW